MGALWRDGHLYRPHLPASARPYADTATQQDRPTLMSRTISISAELTSLTPDSVSRRDRYCVTSRPATSNRWMACGMEKPAARERDTYESAPCLTRAALQCPFKQGVWTEQPTRHKQRKTAMALKGCRPFGGAELRRCSWDGRPLTLVHGHCV